MRSTAPVRLNAAAGFSLVELLLALALAGMVMASLAGLYAANGRANAVATGQARLQESARYALDFIARSARAAGYLGCGASLAEVRNVLNGGWTGRPELDVRAAVQAFDGIDAAPVPDSWRPSLAPLPRRTPGPDANAFRGNAGINVAALTPGSDVLALRYVTGGGPLAAAVPAGGTPAVALDDAFAADDFALIADCDKAALFRVSAVDALPSGGQRLRRAVGAGPFGNAGGALLAAVGDAYGGASHPQGAAVGRVVTDIYFIAPGAGRNERGVATPSLWRKRGTRRPAELIAGIVALQVLLGVDSDGDGALDRYASPAAAAGSTPLALRFAVTATSVDAVPGANPLRRTLERTVALRNPRT